MAFTSFKSLIVIRFQASSPVVEGKRSEDGRRSGRPSQDQEDAARRLQSEAAHQPSRVDGLVLKLRRWVKPRNARLSDRELPQLFSGAMEPLYEAIQLCDRHHLDLLGAVAKMHVAHANVS